MTALLRGGMCLFEKSLAEEGYSDAVIDRKFVLGFDDSTLVGRIEEREQLRVRHRERCVPFRRAPT